MDKLYRLIIVKGFGNEELKMEDAPSYNSKGECELVLDKRLNAMRTHGSLVKGGLRFGGACVEIETVT